MWESIRTTKVARISFLLICFVLILVFGVLIRSNRIRINARTSLAYSSLDAKTNENLQLINHEKFKSFSFAYNGTHLWSMPLADKNYYRLARLLPCRIVDYVYGSRNEKLDSCDQTNNNEFLIETTLHAQMWLYEHQNPVTCSDKKFAIIHDSPLSGFGSTIHQILWAFAEAIAQDRIAVYQTPSNWLYGTCNLGNPDCFFLPISNCSVSSAIGGKNTIYIKANRAHWTNLVFPPLFRNRTLNWYRLQLLFYLTRYNKKTLTHVQHVIAQSFNPPSLDFYRPFIAVYVRRSDKVISGEMSRSYRLLEYIDLFKNDVRRANIRTMYLNSEDHSVFNEFEQLNKDKENVYKLLRINSTRNIVLGTLARMSLEDRGKIILEFLTDLYIEVSADIHAGTLTSNYCRLIDEIRLVLGKIIPYYTPENKYLMDMWKKK